MRINSEAGCNVATSKNICTMTLLFAGLLSTGCHNSTDSSTATQTTTASKTETTSTESKQGSSTTELLVDKSAVLSDKAFVVAATAIKPTTATSTGLDLHSRQVKLTNKKHGSYITTCDDTANLDKATAGDIVLTKYAHRADIDTTIGIYTIETIKLETNSFQLKDVEGKIVTFNAKDPKNLARANSVDSVIVTITDTFAVEVVKVQPQQIIRSGNVYLQPRGPSNFTYQGFYEST